MAVQEDREWDAGETVSPSGLGFSQQEQQPPLLSGAPRVQQAKGPHKPGEPLRKWTLEEHNAFVREYAKLQGDGRRWKKLQDLPILSAFTNRQLRDRMRMLELKRLNCVLTHSNLVP